MDIPIVYDGITLQEGFRLDVLVEREIISEIKAVDLMNPVWEAQVLSHLKLTNKRLGYLINFNIVTSVQALRDLFYSFNRKNSSTLASGSFHWNFVIWYFRGNEFKNKQKKIYLI